jgi:opacity protein-like surface antigen
MTATLQGSPGTHGRLSPRRAQRSLLHLAFGWSLAVHAAAAIAAEPQDTSREDRYEVVTSAQYLTVGAVSQGPTHIDYGDGFGGAIALNYHIDDRLTVGLEFSATGLDSSLTEGGRQTNFSTLLYGGFFTVDYHLLESPLTPFVEAAMGVESFTSEFRGYTSSDTSFAGGGGAGVRWDIGPNWLLKLTYRITATGLQDADNWTTVQTVLLSVGYRF